MSITPMKLGFVWRMPLRMKNPHQWPKFLLAIDTSKIVHLVLAHLNSVTLRIDPSMKITRSISTYTFKKTSLEQLQTFLFGFCTSGDCSIKLLLDFHCNSKRLRVFLFGLQVLLRDKQSVSLFFELCSRSGVDGLSLGY
jgi:hypothetical protein